MNKTTTPAVIITRSGISAIINGTSYVVETDHPKYQQALEAVRQKNWNQFVNLVNISNQVQNYFDGTDVEIKYTGLRPGEKLFEELFSKNEQLVATHHPKILKALRNDLCGQFEEHLQELIQEAAKGNDPAIKKLIKLMVPELEREEKNKLYVVSA